MSNFRPINRDTDFLLPPSVDEWLPQRHLARYVVEVVDQLDLTEMVKAYRGSGSASYHPAMLLSLLVYGYATKVFSSRAIERATYDSVAFRFIAGNEHPDHDTIATFRKRFLPQIESLFVEVLKLAGEMGMLKLGTVALDGTKVHANASRHSALSYGHAKKLEKQLKREVQQLLKLAEQADSAAIPDGMSIPEELERREARLAAIADAKKKIEARAEEREQAEYEAKVVARSEREKQTGKRPPGRPPEPPSGKVEDKEQNQSKGGKMRKPWSIGSVMVFFLSALAEAQDEPGASTDAKRNLEATEEIVVHGERSLSSLRFQMREARERVWEAFNVVNTNDDFDISCSQVRRTGSRVPQRVCQPQYASDGTSRAGKEFVRIIQMLCPVPDSVCLEGALWNGSAEAQREIGKIRYMDGRLDEEFQRLASENPGLWLAIVEYQMKEREYQEARGRVRD